MKVKGTWIYRDKRYILLEEKGEIKPGPNEIILDFAEFVKRLSEMDEEIIRSLSEGQIIHDPTRLLSATSEAIRLGLIFGTKEGILNKLIFIRLKLKELERIRMEMLVDIYQGATDALQAIVLREVGKIIVPKHLANYVKENLPKRYYEDAEYYELIYNWIKKLEHERKLPNYEEMDELIHAAREILEDAE